MRIESPRYTERFGVVRINEVQKVLELDSGRRAEFPGKEAIAVRKIEEEEIRNIEERMAVVIPIKDEKLKLLEGVISGIPHDCLVIVVSNSQGGRIDRFRMEMDALSQFCHFTQRQALSVHQKDPVLARAFAEAGYADMLGEDGLVRDGKCEGMVIGIMLAMLCNKSYVAFTDADNYIPGAVWEYARNFAAGFIMANSPYVMVRNLWSYKPKISEGMYFRKWGRVSEVCNRYMNMIISSKTGFETDVIKTANSGEHAMSMELVELLPYATGFAVEPYELLFLFEQFGGILPMGRREAVKQGIEIFQIETRNPHLHEEKGAGHLEEMLVPALSLFYHSPLCEPDIKNMILEELQSRGSLKPDEEPPKPIIIPPLKKAKVRDFAKILNEHMPSYSALET